MQIFRDVGALVAAGDTRGYIVSDYGFLKGVKVGDASKPIHGYFVGKLDKKPSGLEKIKPQIVLLNHVPVPAPIIAKAYKIFRHVYENYDHAEMIVFLRWKEKEVGDGRKIGRYYLDRADRVEVAAGGLDYVQNVPIVGSIHSHGAFGASFSSVDDRWERDDAPGTYITIGNVDRDVPSIETSIAGLGARHIIDAPPIPKEVFDAVTVTKEELEWWCETVVVKRYSRTTGFYIACGSRIVGWVGDEKKAKLRTGERLVAVKDYKKPEEHKPLTYTPSSARSSFLTPLGKPGTTTTKVAGVLDAKEKKRVEKFIAFLRKTGKHEAFMNALLMAADESELDGIIRPVDLFMGYEEGKDVGWRNLNYGMWPYSDAAESATILENLWEDAFRH